MQQTHTRRLAWLVRTTLCRVQGLGRTTGGSDQCEHAEKIKSIYLVAPDESDLRLGRCDWLDGVYRAFTDLVEMGQRVVLTMNSTLALRDQCWIGTHLVHSLFAELGQDWRERDLRQLVFFALDAKGTRTTVARLLDGKVDPIRGPDLVKKLFSETPELQRLDYQATCRCCTEVLRSLYNRRDENLQEIRDTLAALSKTICFPDTEGGLGRPVDLLPKDGHRNIAVVVLGPTVTRLRTAKIHSFGGGY